MSHHSHNVMVSTVLQESTDKEYSNCMAELLRQNGQLHEHLRRMEHQQVGHKKQGESCKVAQIGLKVVI